MLKPISYYSYENSLIKSEETTECPSQTATDTVWVRVRPMTVDAGEDVAIYSGETTTLGPPAVFGGIPPYAYSWLPVDGLNQPAQPVTDAQPVQTTDYTVTVTDSAEPPHTAQDTVRVLVDGIYELADMNTGTRGWTIFGGADGDDWTVTVQGNAVTSAVAEIAPNAVGVSSTGNSFTYDIRPTVNAGDTGINQVVITAPTGYNNFNGRPNCSHSEPGLAGWPPRFCLKLLVLQRSRIPLS